MLARLNENPLLRSLGLPLLKAFNRDISIRHHWLDRKIKLNLFAHKGYWFHGRHREAEEMQAIRALIAAGDTVVEVGGHIGYISLWFAVNNEKSANRLKKLGRIFSLSYQHLGYINIFLFPFSMISSTYGLSYSIQSFFPAKSDDTAHFISRLTNHGYSLRKTRRLQKVSLIHLPN